MRCEEFYLKFGFIVIKYNGDWKLNAFCTLRSWRLQHKLQLIKEDLEVFQFKRDVDIFQTRSNGQIDEIQNS